MSNSNSSNMSNSTSDRDINVRRLVLGDCELRLLREGALNGALDGANHMCYMFVYIYIYIYMYTHRYR